MAIFGLLRRVALAVMMEASISETSVNFYVILGGTTQRSAICILAAVRT
jgi:hypothetical protein